jgi:hypothetical protein
MKTYQVFIDKKLFKSFKKFVWQLDDSYMLNLGGVQLKTDEDGKLCVNPVYYPLFSWRQQRRSKELTIYLGQISYTFLLGHGLYIFKDEYKEQPG